MAYPFGLAAADVSKVDQERFKWLEYYKNKNSKLMRIPKPW
jgi:hypothetical protein